jgi:hypothetical protein
MYWAVCFLRVDYVDVCVIFLAICILWLVDSPEEGNVFFSFAEL